MEIFLCSPGNNADDERVFLLGNDCCSSQKSPLTVKTLSTVLTVKFVMQNKSYSNVTTLLDEHSYLASKFTPKLNIFVKENKFFLYFFSPFFHLLNTHFELKIVDHLII